MTAATASIACNAAALVALAAAAIAHLKGRP